MRFSAYDDYQCTDFEWMGKIPSSWDIKRIGHHADFITGFAFKSEFFSFEQGIKLVRGDNVTEGMLRWGDKTRYWAEVTKDIEQYLLKDKDILIGMDGSKVGKNYTVVQESDLPLLLVQRVARLRADEGLDYRFLAYLIGSELFRIWVALVKTDPAIPHISPADIRGFPLPYPSGQEQEKIANFLDHETAKIDTLIEKQQQLIQLLKEKRQAVISHAVTKGLNPNAKMRDSGVEWLGEVPEHWEVSKFGYISMVVRGGSPRPAGDPALFNGDYSPWVTVAEITKDDEVYLAKTETFLTKKGSEQCRVFSSGTLLISNSGATLGVPKILSIDANANDGVVGFENLELDHEFSYFYLSTLTDDLRERIKQGSGQPNLNTDIVKNIAVPVPPKNEVSEIVALIQDTRKKYANLMSRATAGIELLQERRTALISAAVTGKIDVRDWVAPPASPTNKEVAA